jgi:hypothetical protein
MGAEYPEVVRIGIVLLFPVVVFALALLAVFAGGHDEPENIQRGGDWEWPSR